MSVKSQKPWGLLDPTTRKRSRGTRCASCSFLNGKDIDEKRRFREGGATPCPNGGQRGRGEDRLFRT